MAWYLVKNRDKSTLLHFALFIYVFNYYFNVRCYLAEEHKNIYYNIKKLPLECILRNLRGVSFLDPDRCTKLTLNLARGGILCCRAGSVTILMKDLN